MNLPVPNEQEVSKMQDLYNSRFGVVLNRNEAYDVLSRIAQLIYLTEYEPVRPLRPQEPEGQGAPAAIY